MIPIKERLESDVLIVGGGIAGLMSAIAAADKGASVTLLDKANTKRSGAGATGNDHFLCYIPEKHGTIDVVYEEFMDSQNATSNDTPLVMRFLETSPTIVNMWNDWGINSPPGISTSKAMPIRGVRKFSSSMTATIKKRCSRNRPRNEASVSSTTRLCWNCSVTITASPALWPSIFPPTSRPIAS